MALAGVFSVIFGVLLAITDAVALTLWLGACAILFGAVLVALSFRLRARRTDHPEWV